ncbi:MAG TPA: iron ABC transporter permease, partial [Burkholderiales bacterium]|nr:iron ABC transporter permease [Burkholderiales bacterium]
MAAALGGPWRRLGSFGVVAVLVAALLALPLIFVLASVVAPVSEAWSHIASTLLPRYVWNTLLLTAGVACGVVSMGVVS